MSYTRKVRIEYYQVVKAPKEEQGDNDKLFSLENLIVKASKLGIKERTYKYYQEEARLDQYEYNEIDNFWHLNFARLRQTKIPSTAKSNEVAKPMKLALDEYIGEEVTSVYDCENHILALQRNRDSLSSTGIEDYLSQLYNSTTHGIYLRPIIINDKNSKLEKAKIFRKITMRFASAKNKTRKNLKKSSFGRLFEYFDEFDSQVATVTMSLGHAKKGSLDVETIKDTIMDIERTEGLVIAAELNIKYSETDPIETIDLFTMKSHDFINIKLEKLETISYKDMADRIRMKYKERKKDLLDSLNI